MSDLYVVLTGNPIDGLSVYGPFEDAEAANEFADGCLRGNEWWSVTLHAPEEA